MSETNTKAGRYKTPLIYKNGDDVKVNKTLHFELDPIEFMDWAINNRFEANELQAGLAEIQAAGLEKKDRDLTQDEVATMLNIIKVLVQLSAGKPSEDGEYFIKDKNWTSSYAYRGFRTFLLEKPKEMNEFLGQLLNNNIMEEFSKKLAKANEDQPEEPAKSGANTLSDEELQQAYRERIQSKVDSSTPDPSN